MQMLMRHGDAELHHEDAIGREDFEQRSLHASNCIEEQPRLFVVESRRIFDMPSRHDHRVTADCPVIVNDGDRGAVLMDVQWMRRRIGAQRAERTVTHSTECSGATCVLRKL